jgi:hypothetical protein
MDNQSDKQSKKIKNIFSDKALCVETYRNMKTVEATTI